MLTQAEFNSLGDMVEACVQGARPVEEVQVELLYGILKEFRTMRRLMEVSDQRAARMAEQFNRISDGGNSLLTERA